MKRTKRRPRGHGPGKGSVAIATSIPVDIDAELIRLALASGITRGAMARECIIDGVERGLSVTRSRTPGNIVSYPTTHPENPTARAADQPPA